MSLLLLFADQESAQAARRRKQTIVLRLPPRPKRIRIVPPLEEWERKPETNVMALSEEDLARALREDEELLLLD